MTPKKILFVVHRYAPFPGGSEIYVQNMAEEMVKRGHQVSVYATTNQGSLNGVDVTNEYNVLFWPWDLIIVHGGDCESQNMAHIHAAMIRSPVLYMIIKPSMSPVCSHGLKFHNFLGYSSSTDRTFLLNWTDPRKARRVRHGVNLNNTISKPPFMDTADVKRKFFMSAGGWWPHKGFQELYDVFDDAFNLYSDAELLLYGYDVGPTGEHPVTKRHPTRINFVDDQDKASIMDAMRYAGETGGAYILNSTEEGFGLVLIEAMLNKCPWIARRVGGVPDLAEYGTVYDSKEELTEILKTHTIDKDKIEKAYQYALANHTIEATCNDLEDVLMEICPYGELIAS